MLVRCDLHSVSDIAQCYSETNTIEEHHIDNPELTVFIRDRSSDIAV